MCNLDSQTKSQQAIHGLVRALRDLTLLSGSVQAISKLTLLDV